MKHGTLSFDGVDYLDGHASDPALLGWMQGSPPPQEKRIRFEDDDFFQFPKIRWTLSHMRELAPTVNVWRGDSTPGSLGEPSTGDQAAIDEMPFTDMLGKSRRWSESLVDMYADGILVLHRGKRVYERYLGALQPQLQHACFSMTKSYVATLAAAMVHEGALDDKKLVPHYLPEMRGTAYEDATLRDVLDMQVGVDYSELYTDPNAGVRAYSRAGGFRARPAGYSGPGNFYDYLQTLRKEGDHGQAFAYKTVNTEVLAWIMKRVSGLSVDQMLSERIWSRIGCEQDAYIGVDSIGVGMAGGGMSASLRDLARFGELMRREGDCGGVQVLPAQVIADTRRGSDPAKFAKAGYTLLSGYSYRNMWWVTHNEVDAFEARGIYGQRLYVAPKAELVIARFASHPVASSAANDPITLPAFLQLARMLQAR